MSMLSTTKLDRVVAIAGGTSLDELLAAAVQAILGVSSTSSQNKEDKELLEIPIEGAST
jgi:hypothetical protein